jgi:hypothetical protein
MRGVRALMKTRLALLWLVCVLAACAVTGPRSTIISTEKIQSLLAQRFPYTGRLGPLFEMQAQTPQVHMLPERNRMGTVLQIQVSERLGRNTYNGTLDVDYGLRYEPSDQTIRLVDLHVNSLDFVGVPERYQSLVQGLAPQLAERLLNDASLYQVSAKDMAKVQSLGYEPGSLEVMAQGLRITLLPKPAQ